MLITTLRSTPCGRSGLAKGSSPAATRSVQSANCFSARSLPMLPSVSAMFVMACPACVRRAQAWNELSDLANSSGTVRMPLLPRAWQDWQEFFTESTQ